MLDPSTPFSTTALITFAIQFTGFLVAYALQTETFYDILGSGNFLLLAIWTYFSSSPQSELSTTATALFLISRTWLLVFLAWRAHDRKGDARFDGVKEQFGLFLIFWMVQALWVWLVSLPTIYVNSSIDSDHETSLYEKAILAIFALSIFIEVTADIQKTVWIKQGRQGGFCTVGLWRYSRHPNYFAEMLMWTCSFLLIVPHLLEQPSLQGCATILSPIFTNWILLFASGTGLTQAEGKGLKRYYQGDGDIAERYAAYRKNTSILVPLVGYSYLPLWFQRVFLLEWERYEYRPSESGKKDS